MDLYHGSPEKFSEFELRESANGTAMGYGIYLTDDKERAKLYSDNGKTEDSYLYTVESPEVGSRELSADTVTLSRDEVATMIIVASERQIEADEYPYMLSDHGEPSSETEMDDGNRELAYNAAVEEIEGARDDLDVINSLYHQFGGNRNAAEFMNAALSEQDFHYAKMQVADGGHEYVVFNPNDVKIKGIDDLNVAKESELDKAAVVQRRRDAARVRSMER